MMGVTQLSAPAFLKCKLSPRGWKFGVRGCSAFEYVWPGTCAHIAQCPSVFPRAMFIPPPPLMRVHTQENLPTIWLLGQRSKPGTAGIGKEGKSNTWKKAKEGNWPSWRWLSGVGRVSGGPQRQNFRLRGSPWGSRALWEKDGPLKTFEQKKCMLVFHWGKTLAQRDSLGRISVRQSQGISSCWHGYGQERTSCCDTAGLKEPNLTLSKETCKPNSFCGAGYGT